MDDSETLPGPPPTLVRHRYAVVNGVRLHCVEAGDGPPVVLLHGFPQFWHTWRHQLPALAGAGFRALAPDQRGYNLSDKPPAVSDYRIERLIADAAGLIRRTGGRAAVVGHDWGGAVAWAVAMRHPELVERLVILNAPHPAAYARELRTAAQLRRSWYVFFFQLPGLPEWVLRRGDFARLERSFRHDPVRPDTFAEEDIKLYKEALARPGALTAALNWYRAIGRRGIRKGDVRPVRAPTLLIWGEQDRYLGPRLCEGIEPWVPDLRVERMPDASHWVNEEWPQRVNRLVIDFLRG